MAARKVRITRKITVKRTVKRTARVGYVAPHGPSVQSSQPRLAVSPSASPAPAQRSITRTSRSSVSPVRVVGENVQEIFGDDPKDYDVFISHASPDKDAIVRPLAGALREGGLEVWYDEFTMRVGDSLRRKIDQGIRSARFGIVVLSPSFLQGRPWTEHELDGIVNAYIYDRQVLLPIWHNVDRDDVMSYSPSLADKVALSTATMSVGDIAADLLDYMASD